MGNMVFGCLQVVKVLRRQRKDNRVRLPERIDNEPRLETFFGYSYFPPH